MAKTLIVDIGSTHRGEYARAEEMLREVASLKNRNVWFKAQLLEPSQCGQSGNIRLPIGDLIKLRELASNLHVPFGASTWTSHGLEILTDVLKCDFLKIAASKSHDDDFIDSFIATGTKVVVSTNGMQRLRQDVINLYCPSDNQGALYPMPFVLDMEAIFKFRSYDGVSLHAWGISQTIMAFNSGAKYVEIHIKPDDSEPKCPDEYFALPVSRLKEIPLK